MGLAQGINNHGCSTPDVRGTVSEQMDLIWRNWLYWRNYKYADWIQRIAMDQQRVRITVDLDERDNVLDEDYGKLERKLMESPSKEKWRIDNCTEKND